MKIYLLGFMGTGKTTLGARAASSLEVPFWDTDAMVEEKSGKDITLIFKTDGEDHFRILESQSLRDTEFFGKALIATGGGLPMHHGNMDWINAHGISAYLCWPDEMLLENVLTHRSQRPMLAGLSEEEAKRRAKTLLEERKPVYENAAMTLSMTGDFEKDLQVLERACRYIW